MPDIPETQTAIAEVATTCGRPPKRFSTKLKSDNEAVIQLEEAMADRSMSTDGLERSFSNRRVGRCRRRVRRLTAIANAEFIINNPRMPRRRTKGTQQRSRALRGTEEGTDDTCIIEEKKTLSSRNSTGSSSQQRRSKRHFRNGQTWKVQEGRSGRATTY